METQILEQTDTLAEYRQQVRDEQEVKSERGKMSDAAVVKFRLIKEQDRVLAIYGDLRLR